jgi:hypothetical protein
MMLRRSLAIGFALLVACTPSAPSGSPAPTTSAVAASPAAPTASGPIASAAAGEVAVEKIPVVLSSPQAQGLLWRPSSAAERKPVALLTIHESADSMNGPFCPDMASRGFQILCMNGRFLGRQGEVVWDDLMLDVKSGVEYLRKRPDISKVFLLGYSGGGQIAGYYQNVAENGVKVCQDIRRITPCSNALADLPKADGVVFGDPIPGLAFTGLTSTDPAVTGEDQFGRIDASKLDASLDMFLAANGFDLKKPTYSADFVKRFHAGQGARYNRLVDLAKSRLETIKSGKGWFPDDEPFVVDRANARLWVMDTDLLARTQKPHTVVTATGQREEVVRSLRPVGVSAAGGTSDTSKTNPLYSQARRATVRSFLSTYAIRTTPDYQILPDSVVGVDWESSNTSLVVNVAGIKSPVLMLSMTGHYWLVTTEMAFNATPSSDKTLAYIEGAAHVLDACKPCETTPGQFGDTRKTIMDQIAKWLNARR